MKFTCCGTPVRRQFPSALSRVLILIAGTALLAGCGSHASGPIPETQAKLGKSAKPGDAEKDVLPPQSEPLLADTQTKEPATSDEPPAEEPGGKVRVLFDGKDLDAWKRTNFGGEGEVEIVDETVVMQRGSDLTGITWAGEPLPVINYEVTLEAQRIDGSDFFCGIVFPYGEDFCSFVAGGWGGSTIGLSSIDGMYAAENETGTYASFDEKKWYKFRLRVSEHAISAWIDGKQYVHLKTKGRKLSLHPLSAPSKPFGISCFACVAAMKDIQLRELTAKEIAEDVEEAK